AAYGICWMRFIVAQMGGRRNYAVPVILEQAGLLERFYTDFAGNAGLGKWLVKFGRLIGCGPLASRLARRRIPDLIKAKTVTIPAGLLREHCEERFCKGDVAERFRSQLRRSRAFGAAAIRHGFGQATHLYSMLGESGPLAGAARRRGLTAVTEVYIL